MAIQEVGVEAVVKGLAAFQGDMRKINQSLQGLRGEGTLLQRAFGSITEGIVNFGAHIARVAEVALGVLLRDAIRAAIDFIGELVQATIDAGSEFQVLEIRLGRLNINQLKEDVGDYVGIGADAAKITQDQLKWLTQLAAKSPYDATDVANMFTMIRTYGFAGDEAKDLTKDILEFTAGMGLTAVEAKRITVNFGQMIQQGKVTQRELNDLARGAFVPVNDILERVSKNTGVAAEEMDDFRKTGESVDAFMEAFSQIVEERFGGSLEDMSNTFKAATDNVLDLVKGIFGLNTVKPILDVLGKRASDFANAFTEDQERWDRLVNAAGRLGEALSGIVTGVLDLLPDTGTLADNIVLAVEGVATWIEEHREDIIGFFQNMADTIKNDVVPWIRDQLVPAIADMINWIIANKDLFLEVFLAFGEVIRDVIIPALVETVIPALQDFLKWITDNKETIKEWIPFLVKAFLILQVIGTVLSIVGGIILSVSGFVIAFISGLAGLIGILSVLANPVIAIVVAALTIIGSIIGIVIGQVLIFSKVIDIAMKIIQAQFGVTKDIIVQKIQNIIDALRNPDWAGIGRAIVQGVANGISSFAGVIVSAARNAAMSAYNAARAALGIKSPSTLFFEIGADTMQGLAIGIQKSAGLAAVTMQAAMARVASSAVPSVTNSTVYNSTSNYNLTVNSSAQTEPIVQDFNMMSSLAGV